MENFVQIMIFITTIVSAWLVAKTDESSKYGFVVGLVGQPFWIYSGIVNEQYGMLALCVFYTYTYSLAIYKRFKK